MVFSSAVFLISFLPITLLVYFLIPNKFLYARNCWLLFVSLIFYSWGEPKYILLMIFSILFNYIFAILIEKRNKNVWLVLDIIFNLSLLMFFKYCNFFIDNCNNLFNLSIKSLSIALPIGISFYTFQTMSYVIDVYRKKVEVQKDIVIFSTYVTLFPQLIAGPIVRYSDVERELKIRSSNLENISYGIKRFIIGLGKKVLIANQVATIWDMIYDNLVINSSISFLGSWLGALSFTLQIYFDFSGYSDMAIGLGKIFGFNYLENFDYPYISKSITEFWRRWHISLSSWFKEYVYIPLGGNKKHQVINILIVWALTGFWHGASWNFVLWGIYYGILLIIEKKILKKYLEKIPKMLQHFYTMIIVTIGWVIFNITDFNYLKIYLSAMFLGSHIVVDDVFSYYIVSRLSIILIAILASTPILKKVCEKISNCFKKRKYIFDIIESIFMLFVLIFSISYIVSGSYNPFLYFRF